MTTNILLVKPEVAYPVKKQGQAGDVDIPLGLLYLADYAREHSDCEVDIIDYRLGAAQGKPRDLEHDLAPYDIVGTGACTSESPDALHILDTAKSMGKITIAGGLYPTFNREQVLRTGNVDYVVKGEGEQVFSDLIRAIQGKVPLNEVRGISFLENGSIIDTPHQALIQDLDVLRPAYDLIDISQYQEFGETASIYSARGCPMACKFCTLNELWKFKYRTRSFENILEEMEFLKSAGYNRINFKDETITVKKKWARGLFEAIEEADLGMTLKAKSRISEIEPDMVERMVRAGIDTIHTGVESVSERALASMHKGYKAEKIEQAFQTTLDYGININPVYMFSWAGETPEDLHINADFIKRVGSREGVITYITFITPHPGSGIEHDPGFQILSTDYARYTHKQPVAVPISLGESGLRLMVNQYHDVTRAIGMEHLNPRVDERYLKTLETKLNEGVIAA